MVVSRKLYEITEQSAQRVGILGGASEEAMNQHAVVAECRFQRRFVLELQQALCQWVATLLEYPCDLKTAGLKLATAAFGKRNLILLLDLLLYGVHREMAAIEICRIESVIEQPGLGRVDEFMKS